MNRLHDQLHRQLRMLWNPTFQWYPHCCHYYVLEKSSISECIPRMFWNSPRSTDASWKRSSLITSLPPAPTNATLPPWWLVANVTWQNSCPDRTGLKPFRQLPFLFGGGIYIYGAALATTPPHHQWVWVYSILWFFWSPPSMWPVVVPPPVDCAGGMYLSFYLSIYLSMYVCK